MSHKGNVIQTTRRHWFTHPGAAVIAKKKKRRKRWRGRRQMGPAGRCSWRGKWCGHWELWRFLGKSNAGLSQDSAVPVLGVCLEELKAGAQTCACTRVCIAVLFTISKRGGDLNVRE